MYMNILPACMSVYHMHAWCWQRPEEDIGSPWTGVTGRCEFALWILGIESGSQLLSYLFGPHNSFKFL